MRYLKVIFSFNGSIHRWDYFSGLFLLVIATGSLLLIPHNYDVKGHPFIAYILYVFIASGAAIGYVGLIIKRLRDMQWPSALVVLFFVPPILLIMHILSFFIPGKTTAESPQSAAK